MLKKLFLMLSIWIFTCSVVQAQKSEFYLDEIVVTATRTEQKIDSLPTNVTVVSQKEIKSSNAQTVGEIIKDVVGVTEVSRRGIMGAESNIRLRSGGDSSKQVLVMVDGRSVNSLSLGEANITDLVLDNVDRIEIVRGPASALYGSNALGGVVNVITKKSLVDNKKNGSPVTELYMSQGNFGSQVYRVNFGIKKDNWENFVSFSKNSCAGWRENSDYNNYNFATSLGYAMPLLGKLSFQIGALQSNLGVPGSNFTPLKEYDGAKERKAYDPESRQDTQKYFGLIEYNNQWNEFIGIQTKCYLNYDDQNYRSPVSFTHDDSQSSDLGLDAQVNTVYNIILGGKIEQQSYHRKNLITSTDDVNQKTLNNAIFVQKEFSFAPFTAVAGFRYDKHNVFGDQVNPRLNMTYYPLPNLKLSSTLGRAFRSPTFEDLYSPYRNWPASLWGPAGDTQGNVSLKPERSWGYDFGIEFQLSKYLLNQVTFFRNDVNDLIEWKDLSTDWTYQQWRPVNIGQSYSQGIELVIKNNILQNLRHSLNYTYLESKGKKESQTEWNFLQYTPPHKLNYQLSYEHNIGTKLDFNVSYTAKQEWQDDWQMLHSVAGYTLMDIKLSQKLFGLNLFFNIDNLLDTKYQSREGFPLPGRIFNIGISTQISI